MKREHIFWGFFFLLSAAFIIAGQVVSFGSIGVVSILATVFLAAIMISSLVKLEFFGVFVPIAFLYTIYDEPLGLKPISFWAFLAAMLLLSLGFSLIFHKRNKAVVFAHCAGGDCGRSGDSLDDNNPVVGVNLGSSVKYLQANSLKSGRFSANLGELEVYFDQVQLSPEGAEVVLDCSLASIKLYIPRHWNVVDKVGVVLGDVKNTPRRATPDTSLPPLTLTGNVKLGSVEILYI